MDSTAIRSIPAKLSNKRKRLNAVLDKISHLSSGSSGGASMESSSPLAGRRRELWRETQQKSVEEVSSIKKEDSDEVFSPTHPGPSRLDSPKICFSPLRIEEDGDKSVPPSGLPAYLAEFYRRKCLSDTDLSSSSWEDIIRTKVSGDKGGSLDSSQDSPLDLSVRSSVSSGSSETSSKKRTLFSLEASATPLELSYVCPVCGQMFSLHDRLGKHMASRHKSKSTDSQPNSSSSSSTKAYACAVCKRSFARSDMLTRHMRLHTGIKPYTCRICGQVFSRSDHLSTHQRTHTGEKPYRCPSCPYAACRRDMITRHMRTHARYELSDSTSIEENSTLPDSSADKKSSSTQPTSPMDVVTDKLS